MTTQSTLRIFAHLWVASTFLALAFDPLGIKYEVAGTHLARRVTETGDSERPYEVDGNTFIANTDSSASFSLEDCQNQQADPPAVADGSSSMSVASSGAEDLEISADTAEAGTMGSNTGTAELSTTESDAEESDTSESNTASAESSAVGSDSTESKTAPDTAGPDTTESDAMDSSGATESETAGSNTAEADSAGSDSKDADETVANPALVSQTTIPYDSEFDLSSLACTWQRVSKRVIRSSATIAVTIAIHTTKFQTLSVLLVTQTASVARTDPPTSTSTSHSLQVTAMFAALAPMQPASNNPSHYPWTPELPSPLSPRRQSTTAAAFTTTTPITQPQYQPPVFTLTPSPSPSQNKSGAIPSLRTPNANATTSPTPSSNYATRYKNTISNPLFAHSSKRVYTSSTSPRARSVRRSAFLNRIKQDRENGRVEARVEQLAYIEGIAEQKEWAESMKRISEEIQARYGLGIEEGEGEDEYEHFDAEAQALDEYLEQERAIEMALLEAMDADSAVGGAGNLPNVTGHRVNDAASSFSDEEYDNIFMDLVDHSPPEDMDMSG
ncbi:hypothetical protein BDW75DRAFT_230027 [Aspergillus navahoensis]